MLPKTRADQIFPGACGDYTAHLGEHQPAAFTVLWNRHDSPTRSRSRTTAIPRALRAAVLKKHGIELGDRVSANVWLNPGR